MQTVSITCTASLCVVRYHSPFKEWVSQLGSHRNTWLLMPNTQHSIDAALTSHLTTTNYKYSWILHCRGPLFIERGNKQRWPELKLWDYHGLPSRPVKHQSTTKCPLFLPHLTLMRIVLILMSTATLSGEMTRCWHLFDPYHQTSPVFLLRRTQDAAPKVKK